MGKLAKVKSLWKDRDNQFRYAKWLMKYTKPYAWKIAVMMFFNIATTVITLVMAIVTKDIIDNAIGGVREKVITGIIIYGVMIIAMQIAGAVFGLLSTMLAEKFSFGIRKQIYDKILESSWLEVQKYHTGDLMTRLTSDAGAIADGIFHVIPGIITLGLELVMVFFILFFYSPGLAVFALLIAPVVAVITVWFGGKLKRLQIKVQESESAYRSFLQESIANLLIMKSFSNEEYASNRLVDLREKRFYWVLKKTKFGLVSSTSMSMSFQLGYIVAFTYGALQVAAGAITYGTMSIFLTLVNRIQSPLMMIAREIPKVVAILASAGRVMELQDIPAENYEKENLEARGIGVKVNNVSFGYSDELVLDGVNMEVKPGEMVVVMGESGIGKTTLIRLIMSFATPDSGEIMFYNEQGQTEKANATCRKFMSYVPQGNTLFSGTIRENIRMGRLDATEEEMIEALKMTASYDFVMNLPHGLDTVIGEKGHGLSEGQAQRIAVARALVRKAPFLILDEATSALDEQTEWAVLEGIQKQSPKPTCLVITHRKSVLKYCDREIVVKEKNAKEQV